MIYKKTERMRYLIIIIGLVLGFAAQAQNVSTSKKENNTYNNGVKITKHKVGYGITSFHSNTNSNKETINKTAGNKVVTKTITKSKSTSNLSNHNNIDKKKNTSGVTRRVKKVIDNGSVANSSNTKNVRKSFNKIGYGISNSHYADIDTVSQ